MQGFKEEIFLCGWVSVLWRIFPWKVEDSVSHPPPSRNGLFRLSKLKTWWPPPSRGIPWKHKAFHKAPCAYSWASAQPPQWLQRASSRLLLGKPEAPPLHPQAPWPATVQLLWVPGHVPLTFPEIVFWVASCQLFPFPSRDLPRQSGAQLASLGWGWRFLPGDPSGFYWINVFGYSQSFFSHKNRPRRPSHFRTQQDFFPNGQAVRGTRIPTARQQRGHGRRWGRTPVRRLATSLFSATVIVTNEKTVFLHAYCFLPPLRAKNHIKGLCCVYKLINLAK